MTLYTNEQPVQDAVIVIENPPRPIIDPLLNLFRSRKFIALLLNLAFSLLVLAVPEAEQFRTEVIALASGVTAVLIHSIAKEDAAKYGREVAAQPVMPTPDLVREIATEVVNTVLLGQQPTQGDAPGNGIEAETISQPRTLGDNAYPRG